jgi:hypothetical protein
VPRHRVAEEQRKPIGRFAALLRQARRFRRRQVGAVRARNSSRLSASSVGVRHKASGRPEPV